MKTRRKASKQNLRHSRIGAASLDSVLVLAVIVPLIGFLLLVVPRMIQLVYELTVVAIGIPFM